MTKWGAKSRKISLSASCRQAFLFAAGLETIACLERSRTEKNNATIPSSAL
jgi:hypothetical protein